MLNGAKNFITHGKSSNIAVVIARTGKVGDSHGMTAFVIEKPTEGFTHGRKEDKLGMRASETTELIFTDCRVPKENILGEVGEGFIQSMKVLGWGANFYCCAKPGYCPRGIRGRYSILQGASPVQPAYFQLPGHCFQARRYGY